jgi:hypothetical protein
MTASQRMEAVWKLSLQAYGLDPNNPPKMRKDIVRIIRPRR